MIRKLQNVSCPVPLLLQGAHNRESLEFVTHLFANLKKTFQILFFMATVMSYASCILVIL